MRNRFIQGIGAVTLILFLGALLWFSVKQTQMPDVKGDLLVTTTIYPLQDFVQNVGGEFVRLNNVIPAGAEPHDYEPSPKDVAKVIDADVLVYNGAGLDQWAEDLVPEVQKNGGVTVSATGIVASDLITEDRVVDPHVWLDPVLAQKIVGGIRDALIQADPQHATQYTENADVYLRKLQDLDITYVSKLTNCELNDIIVSHNAFAYLAHRYGFTLHAISGLAPEAEPSAHDLAELAILAQQLNVNTVFFETLVSPRFAEALAQEVGIETAVLDPIEGLPNQDLVGAKDYISIMLDNLEALRTALLCR